ncbi:hypothetical protein L598_001500000250 [Mesorhizobium sp. J18]|uniref:hypothetical protein n=1 Tax=Mesorhizobium sp. J18 TaxID=935263 RepID=UPI00119BE4B4|nr:hypothetical protein [Mesorhizobium sp. J18]TWG99302.1 hypothetical protein L598_001500000250 [Mesorhizobium sp. J18]
MTVILPFHPRPRSQAGQSAADRGPAKIVIFPGIRYEREDGPRKPDENAAERAGRKRGQIKN